jgi:hypothetical protein
MAAMRVSLPSPGAASGRAQSAVGASRLAAKAGWRMEDAAVDPIASATLRRFGVDGQMRVKPVGRPSARMRPHAHHLTPTRPASCVPQFIVRGRPVIGHGGSISGEHGDASRAPLQRCSGGADAAFRGFRPLGPGTDNPGSVDAYKGDETFGSPYRPAGVSHFAPRQRRSPRDRAWVGKPQGAGTMCQAPGERARAHSTRGRAICSGVAAGEY